MSKFKFFLAAALCLAMATPALADFSLYGSARMSVFYDHTDAGDAGNGATTDSLHDTLQTNSRLGAKFNTNDIFGHVELGLKGNQDGNGVYTRLLYGVYKFDGVSILLGQTYTPYTFFSEQVWNDDNDFIGFGATYDSRQPMIKFTLDNGLYLALIQPKSPAVNANDATKAIMPKVAVGFDGKFGNVAAGAGVAYNGYKDTTVGKTINSYLVYGHGKVDLNPVDLTAAIHYGQNLDNFGISGRSSSKAIMVGTSLENSTSFGGWFQVGFALAPNAKLDAGVAYVSDDNDAYAEKDEKMSYFVNTSIKVAKSFTIVPEIDYFDYMKNTAGVDQGSGIEAGAKLQMDF